MKDSLRTAAAIRRKLKGLTHSNSTELLVEDRGGITDESRADLEFALGDILSGVTKENRHSEVNFGASVGKEKC